jgi:hypothetical protein
MGFASDHGKHGRDHDRSVGKEIHMTRIRLIAFSSAVVMAALSGVGARAAENGAAAGPVYNGATKSYFQLVTVPARRVARWNRARARARQMVFNGVRGRLAVVDSAEIMAFVRDNFEVAEPTWVGARFFCGPRKLLWENAKIQDRGDYARWHRRWASSARQCSKVRYMPLFLTAEREGFYWRASEPRQGLRYALVEFATGKQ